MVVKVLIEYGKSNIDVTTERSATALYVAAQRGHYVRLFRPRSATLSQL